MTEFYQIDIGAKPSVWRSTTYATGRLVRTTGLRLGKGQRRNRRRRIGVDFVPYRLDEFLSPRETAAAFARGPVTVLPAAVSWHEGFWEGTP